MEAPYFFHRPLTLGRLSLDREESKHAGGSHRLRPGHELVLVDGQGSAARAVVVERKADGLEVEVSQVERRPAAPLAGLTIATALPKGKRQNYLFEKCAELGVGRIVATNFSRSVARAESHRLEGWAHTCRQAIKQSRQAWAPLLEVCDSPKQLIEQGSAGAKRLLATADRNAPWISQALSGAAQTREVLAVIGPEGGLSTEEQRLFAEAGFQPVSLGASVLRVETAGLVLACHLQAHLDPIREPQGNRAE